MTTDADYIDSYARTDIHAEMLDDRARTETYRRAILDLDLRGKTVLDVGAGTGILSLFAAEAGAEHVYAVEASDLASVTRQIVADNQLQDRITVLEGKVEDQELPGPVDVIVSEWMGYFLIFERMLDSVLIARDRWLAPGGRLLPGTATLLLFAIEDHSYVQKRFGWWDDVYGFDLSAMVDRARSEAVVEDVDAEAVVTDLQPVLELDIATMDVDEQEFQAAFTLTASRTDTVHAIVGAFDVTFNEDDDDDRPLTLSTDPDAEATHWKQTIFYLDRPLKVRRGDELTGTIDVRRHPSHARGLMVELEVRVGDAVARGAYRV
jgi:protein arginine N-methyltransferase 1